jgi:hypothetical protein
MQLLGAKIVKTYTASDFHGLFDSEVLKQVKNCNMDKEAVKNLMFGGFCELTRDSRFYHHSAVGPEYCYFTDRGKIAITDFMIQMAVNIHKAEVADLDRRAKEMVIKGLKGESV